MINKLSITILIFIINTSFISIKSDLISIEIYKENRTLSVKKGTVEIAKFSMVLGFNPVGDKMQEGDGKTPEGVFRIKAMYPHKSWRKFIWFDYPNQESIKRFGLRKKNGQIDKHATIGGDVGIHGVPHGMDAAIDQKNDWTFGCISLKNKHIDSVYNLVKIGTQVYIKP